MVLKYDEFALDNFEGTLDFLLCLIQKDEIDLYDIPIQELIHQFISQSNSSESTNAQSTSFQSISENNALDRGAEFIGSAAYLVWLKSKRLLPSHEQPDEQEECKIEDPHFEIIHHHIDYCRFKQAAKELTFRQEKQQACYFRGVDLPEWRKPLGIDHVSLEELSGLFKEMIQKASLTTAQIQEENWRVSDKIRFLRQTLQLSGTFSLSELFTAERSRPEMIVIFLALLELMKMGELAVGREHATGFLVVYQRSKRELKEQSREDQEARGL